MNGQRKAARPYVLRMSVIGRKASDAKGRPPMTHARLVQALNNLDANVLSQIALYQKVYPRPTHALMRGTLAAVSFVHDSVGSGRATSL